MSGMTDKDTTYLQSHGILVDPEPVPPSLEDHVMAWIPCRHCGGELQHAPDCRYAEPPGLWERVTRDS